MSDPGSQPAPDDDDTDNAPPADDQSTDDNAPPTDDDADDASGPQVLLTVEYDSSSGEFTLIEGDEPDDDDAGAGEAGASPAEGGGAAPAGKKFPDKGPLLKAILDILTSAEDSGAGSAQSNFSAGFNSDKSPTLKS